MSDDERVQVDVIVVGAGPAGLSAAYVMAQAGLEVIVVERGETAGSKNVSGLLYGTVLNQMMPEFHERAPIERSIAKRSIGFLGDGMQASITFGSDTWSSPPYNNTFMVYRAPFDRWFAGEVEEADAALLEGVVVDGLIYEGEGDQRKAVGVRIRDDEDFYADLIILADGANAIVAEEAFEQLSMKPGKHPQAYALGVKEIIGLPRERIEDRFALEGDEGMAMDLLGSPFEGLVGAGFIYTAKESLAIGFAAKVDSIATCGRRPDEIIDLFKNHAQVRRLLQGGELLEYSAHLIPEGGYQAVPELVGNGVMVVGDAAGLVNMSLYHEGSNLAMASGKLAGEVAIEAKEKGDFSKQTLGEYPKRLESTFVMQDLKKYQQAPEILDHVPAIFAEYPARACQLLVDYFRVCELSKAEVQKQALKHFLDGLPKLQFGRDLLRVRKLI